MDNFVNFAAIFPTHFFKLIQLNMQAVEFLQSLSPNVQSNVLAGVDMIKRITISLLNHSIAIYPSIMKIGTKELHEFKQPSKYVLAPLAKISLFLFPTNNMDLKISSKTILIGNQQVFSIGTISIVASIYMKTGVLVRCLVDSSNFKIPGWKHFIECFGAMDAGKVTLDEVCALDYPVLIYPSGRTGFFKKSVISKYDLDFTEQSLKDVMNAMSKHSNVR